jgi:hypothetical protein
MTTNTDAVAGTGQVTLADVVNAASDTLRDIESGVLSAAEVQRRAVDACRELFGCVSGEPDDPLRELHTDVIRQGLGAGYLSADELAEWLAVQRRREAGSDPPDQPLLGCYQSDW